MMHLIATNVCMWIRVLMQQTVASISTSISTSHYTDSTDNTSQLISDLNVSAPRALYTVLHHTSTPSSSSSSSSSSSAAAAAAAVTQIHLSGIGLISDYDRHWNATGESSVITCLPVCFMQLNTLQSARV